MDLNFFLFLSDLLYELLVLRDNSENMIPKKFVYHHTSVHVV